MKGLKIILIPIILFIFVFAILFAYLVMPKNNSIRESNFPNFSMTDLRGNSVNQDFFFLDEYKVLNVWATWCVNCKLEHGFLMDLQSKGIRIIGLNYKDNKSKAIKWLNQFGNPYWFSIFDPEGSLGIEIGVAGAPETYLLNKDNTIIQKHIGIVNSEIWDKKFKELMK